jgi:hypothetical protein
VAQLKTSGPTVTLSDQVAFGDLNGDGRDEAVTLLISTAADGSSLYDLAVVTDHNGTPTNIATTALEPGIEVQSLSISNGTIVINLTAPGAAAAQTRRYRLESMLVEVSEAEAATEVSETEVITFIPMQMPTQRQSGSCFGSALGVGRADAYRCTVGNTIYDPCFIVDNEPTLVCGADPTTNEIGFVLELTEPLPAPDASTLPVAQPWLIELADGPICGLMQGTRPGNEQGVGAYGCTDQTYLLEDLQPGDVWQAEQVVFDLGDDGFVITDSKTVALRRVWQ